MPGHYSAAGAAACTPAPAGSYVGQPGQTEATLCSPGSFSSFAGASSCTLAPADSYVPSSGATSATPCPAGSTSSIGAVACTVSATLTGFPSGTIWVGEPVLYQASVPKGSSSAVAAGTVTFAVGGSTIHGCNNLKLVNGSAYCLDAFWTGGVYTVTAAYSAGTNITTTVATLYQTVYQSPELTGSRHATTSVGGTLDFQVTAQGYPAPMFKEHGALPGGVTFSLSGLLSGSALPGTGGVYQFEITASSPAGSDSEGFTLVVDQAPAITSANHDTVTLNKRFSFQVTSTGYPAPSFSATGLPKGVTLSPSGTLSGTPTTTGAYVIAVSATNSVSTVTQQFTLTT